MNVDGVKERRRGRNNQAAPLFRKIKGIRENGETVYRHGKVH
jgi:hypothetical protein